MGDLWSHKISTKHSIIQRKFESLLQSATTCYYKVRQISLLQRVTTCYYKGERLLYYTEYYKVRQLFSCEMFMKVIHRYRGGHGFESRWSPDIFQASSFQLLKLENLLRWSLFTFSYFITKCDSYYKERWSLRTATEQGLIRRTLQKCRVFYAFLNCRFRRKMSHNSFTFFYVVIAIGIISWDNYKLFQTIKQCKSEITSSGHRRDLGLNVPEVKLTKSLFPAS